MPPMRDCWRLALEGIDEESRLHYGVAFTAISAAGQDAVLEAIQRGDVGGHAWKRVPARRFFVTVLLKAVVGEYYAHPAAWSEIGFGGPASPRGYVRMGLGERDPWEAEASE
jgi:hypothetical protein